MIRERDEWKMCIFKRYVYQHYLHHRATSILPMAAYSGWFVPDVTTVSQLCTGWPQTILKQSSGSVNGWMGKVKRNQGLIKILVLVIFTLPFSLFWNIVKTCIYPRVYLKTFRIMEVPHGPEKSLADGALTKNPPSKAPA